MTKLYKAFFAAVLLVSIIDAFLYASLPKFDREERETCSKSLATFSHRPMMANNVIDHLSPLKGPKEPKAYYLGTEVSSLVTLVTGFSAPEHFSRWTEGDCAEIKAHAYSSHYGRLHAIQFEGTSAMRDQQVDVYVNDEYINTYLYHKKNHKHTIHILIPHEIDFANIKLRIPTVNSYQEANPGNANHRLGISINMVKLIYMSDQRKVKIA